MHSFLCLCFVGDGILNILIPIHVSQLLRNFVIGILAFKILVFHSLGDGICISFYSFIEVSRVLRDSFSSVLYRQVCPSA
ncbi:hypothetical protein Daci_3875 [Delftia acidovorans SPH-1]|uniref:Uncharacterized protein n=1 Tax=Delftia acidovorans (strain DSM 14801 / SPH-1) TaxID=398578 RepID=A9BLM1_DELAS|nr:hypothetical protein Daci_3875 [Delftia acidovorans SPH-1]